MMEHVLAVYGYGYDIEAIAYDVDKTEEEVLDILKQFKSENSKSGRHYSERLQALIIGRFKCGVTPFIIEKELGIGKGVVKRFLQKQGFEILKGSGGKKTNVTYTVIQHENFCKCPDCGSERVNKIEDSKTHSYCFDCGTEWYKDGSEIHKVLFHELNDDDDQDE